MYCEASGFAGYSYCENFTSGSWELTVSAGDPYEMAFGFNVLRLFDSQLGEMNGFLAGGDLGCSSLLGWRSLEWNVA